jgi:hypothetical protein
MASTSAHEGELKVQGVIEVAQDPDSKVTAEDAEKKMLNEARKAGVPAFHFDPDASAEERRALLKDVGATQCCWRVLGQRMELTVRATLRPPRASGTTENTRPQPSFPMPMTAMFRA